MKTVFLSGQHNAQEDLTALADALIEVGLKISSHERFFFGFGRDWSEHVFSAIKQSDVFVAFLDNSSSNVMFELGYAMGAGKSVLLIRRPSVEIPFDVASLPMLKFDRFDRLSVMEAVKRIEEAAVKSRRENRYFETSTQMLRQMVEDESYLDEVEPRTFEECIANVLNEMGFTAELMSSRNERGFDIRIDDFCNGDSAIVQVKKLNRNGRLSVSEVQRVVGAAVTARVKMALIVTSGAFTSSAKYFAEESPIPVLMLTIDDLILSSKRDLIQKIANV